MLSQDTVDAPLDSGEISLKLQWAVSIIAILLLCACSRSASHSSSNSPSVSKAHGVVVVCIDALRADHVTSDLMPNLSDLAHESASFRRAYSNAPWTIPSIASVFTGTYPSYHGLNVESHLVALRGLEIRTDILTIAEMLAQHDFMTAAFFTHGPLGPKLGFSRGFKIYGEIERVDGHDIVQISERVREFLEHAQQPFFLYLHTFEAHLPDTSGSYQGDLRYLDQELERLFTLVKEHAETLIVFSDHGEDISRPERRHGFDLTDELLHVPLLIGGTGIVPALVNQPVQLVDLKPTIADRVGLDKFSVGPGQGRSLLPFVRGETVPPVPIIAEAPLQGPGWLRIAWMDFALVLRPDNQSRDHWWWKEPKGPKREFIR